MIGSVISGGQTSTGGNILIGGQSNIGSTDSGVFMVNNSASTYSSSGISNAFFVKNVGSTTATSPALIYNQASGQIQYSTSSITNKINVVDITSDTSKVFDINVVEYDEKSTGIHRHAGVIAEEVFKIDNKLTWNNVDGTIGGIDSYYINMYLLNECKKMYTNINTLNAQVLSLQEQINKLNKLNNI